MTIPLLNPDIPRDFDDPPGWDPCELQPQPGDDLPTRFHLAHACARIPSNIKMLNLPCRICPESVTLWMEASDLPGEPVCATCEDQGHEPIPGEPGKPPTARL